MSKKQVNKKNEAMQVIEITSNLMDVTYVPVEDILEIQSIERGDNGWREASVESRGLVRCTAPIKGTVYKIRVFGSSLDKHYTKAVILRVLGSKKGRIFLDPKGVIRVVFDLPQNELDFMLKLIMKDAYELAGIII